MAQQNMLVPYADPGLPGSMGENPIQYQPLSHQHQTIYNNYAAQMPPFSPYPHQQPINSEFRTVQNPWDINMFSKLQMTDKSVPLPCPWCGENIVTKIEETFPKSVCACSVLMCFSMVCLPFFWIPCCLSFGKKDVSHLCPRCNKCIGKHQASACMSFY